MENFLTAIENHTWLSLLLFFAIIAIISEINVSGIYEVGEFEKPQLQLPTKDK